MLLQTQTGPLRKARTVNFTTNGFPARIPTTTLPAADAGTATGSAAIDLASPDSGQGSDGGSGANQNSIFILPYAIGSNNNTFSFKVIGWRKIPGVVGTTLDLWIPINFGEFACTISSTVPGIAGASVLNTEMFADTITVTKGSTLSGEAPSENIISPADDSIGSVLVDVKGCQKVELIFTTGGSATSCNALIALM